jgi:peptidoglycan/xylan/chitin deacetylase (PgdA/CDA1 family)
MTIALIYHDIIAAGERDLFGFPGPAASRYKLDPAHFEAHLQAIAATGASVGLFSDTAQVALTFDDGGASAIHAADALERRGWRGHFFITTGRIGTPGFLGSEQVRELAARGHEVGSHSVSHPTYMGALDRDQLAAEWGQSRRTLSEILGDPPRTAAVPGGFVSHMVIDEAARAGYSVLMTSQPTVKGVLHKGVLVHGRCTIWASTSPERAAAYARTDRLALAGLRLAWEAKSAPKRLSPDAYEALRQCWARWRSGPLRSR